MNDIYKKMKQGQLNTENANSLSMFLKDIHDIFIYFSEFNKNGFKYAKIIDSGNIYVLTKKNPNNISNDQKDYDFDNTDGEDNITFKGTRIEKNNEDALKTDILEFIKLYKQIFGNKEFLSIFDNISEDFNNHLKQCPIILVNPSDSGDFCHCIIDGENTTAKIVSISQGHIKIKANI